MKPVEDLLFEKGLPSDVAAEKLVLASCLNGRQALENVTVALRPQDFSLEANRRIFETMVHLDSAGSVVDRVTVVSELNRQGHLESVGGAAYVASLDEGMPALCNLDAYVSLVRDKSTQRRFCHTTQAALEECLSGGTPTNEILTKYETVVGALSAERTSASFKTPFEVITRAGGIDTFLHPDQRRGVPTPWPVLNSMLVGGGLMPGQMVVIGARPSMGKTALACQIADGAASSETGVAFFTLEMPDQAILMRMASARAQVDGLKVTRGYANPLERKTLAEAFTDLADEEKTRLWIDDSTGCTVPAMRAALRKLTAKHAIGLVVIDYLQLVETTGGAERRYEQVSEISRGVKRIAREFNVPVVVLAQLNRESEKESRKPRPSDLRDSGSIEQDADVILMPHRQDGQDEHSDVLMVDLIVTKQRNGPLGRVPLKFLKRYAKFIEPETKSQVA